MAKVDMAKVDMTKSMDTANIFVLSMEQCPNISTTPLQQCLPFSWTTLRGKHCRHPIAVMGVVDTFGQCLAIEWELI